MLRAAVFLIVTVTTAACSSGGSTPASSPTAPTPTTTTPNTPTTTSGPSTITITPAGMVPLELTIAVGQRVTFVNSDTRSHDVVGGVDPNHADCPEILQAGFLLPGRSGDTGVFTTPRTCEYHDHTMLGVPSFQGRIIIR